MKCELELVCIWNIFVVKKDNYVLINKLTQTTSKDFNWNHKTNPSGHLKCRFLSAAHVCVMRLALELGCSGLNAVRSGNFLPTFRYNLSVPSSRVKNSCRRFGTTYRSHLQGSRILADVSVQPIGPIFKGQEFLPMFRYYLSVPSSRVKNSCRRFGTTYRSHLQGSRMTLEGGTVRLYRDVGKKKLPLRTAW